ncbi:MAG: HAD family phosphatase [Candidatus Cloacimonetes bacterium]|nr:HAD family phosphatase [Candidatus Cloacimonadota bacterium]
MKDCKIIFTDLDGTLLGHDRIISADNLSVLNELGKRKIVRVLATGRSLYSLARIIEVDFPHFDYIIFSCGVGIIDWTTKQILCSYTLSKNEINLVRAVLDEHNIDYMIHKPVPENHKFHYQKFGKDNHDFDKRFSFYADCGKPLPSHQHDIENASQVLAIIPDQVERFEIIKNTLSCLKVIRTTSPIDHQSLWIEIFPQNVSKGHAAEWLCNHLNIAREYTIGIGNDYNDLDLLEWTAHSYVVENAPEELRKRFKVTASNQSSGFAKVINEWVL